MHYHQHSLKAIFHDHLTKKEERKISIDKLSIKAESIEDTVNKENSTDSLFNFSIKNKQLIRYSDQHKCKSNTQRASDNQFLLKSFCFPNNFALPLESLTKASAPSLTYRSHPGLDKAKAQFGSSYRHPSTFPLMTPYQKMKTKETRDKRIIDFNRASLGNKHRDVNALLIIPKLSKKKPAKVSKAKSTLWYFNNLNLKMTKMSSKDNDSSVSTLRLTSKSINAMNILLPEQNNLSKLSKNNNASSVRRDLSIELSRSDSNISLSNKQFLKDYNLIGNKKLRTVLLEHLSQLNNKKKADN